MNLVVDENIAFASKAFSEFGEVRLMSGRKISNEKLRDVDVLIVRSITKVDESLLNGTNVKFVGTVTIGTDHIDLDYLRKNGIQFTDAKGCNADSVAEYVFTALLKIANDENFSLKGKLLGVVGVGNIGSRVVKLAQSLGMNVMKNDPPLEREGIGSGYVSLDEILKTDIITFHVPLNTEGVDKTFHLLNESNLRKIKEGTVIINTSRGAVIDNYALLKETLKRKFKIVLDVWEGEPSINTELLETVKIGTPHIAGYSFDGKVNGTKLIYDALCRFTGKKPKWRLVLPQVENSERDLQRINSYESKLFYLFNSIYDIEKDDEKLRLLLEADFSDRADYFDKLRKEYPVRREFNDYAVNISEEEMNLKRILEAFRFNVKIT